jgi:carbon storage regulator
MLVLSRKTNETIVIDGRITLEILQIKGNQIRVGINAPASVRIRRGELTPYGTESTELATSDSVTIDLAQVG